jgi:hypothetical protein
MSPGTKKVQSLKKETVLRVSVYFHPSFSTELVLRVPKGSPKPH